MAVFRDNTDDFQRLDFELLQNGFVTLYHRSEILAEDIGWLEKHSYKIDTFNCSRWLTQALMLEDFAQKLSFPDYFGQNLDAFNDCLSDIEISDEGGRAFVLNRFDSFAERMPDVACSILDIIADKSRLHLLFGKRLITLTQSNNPNLDADLGFPSLGASHLIWNRREWLSGRRNLSEIFN